MVKFGHIVLLFLIATLSAAPVAAADRPIDISIEGSAAGQYWICLVTQDPNHAEISNTSIRQLVDKASGQWTQIARMQARVIDIAALGDRLAVLTSTGEWQIVWKGASTLGTPLPDNRIATRISGDDESLLAVTRRADGGPALSLFRWTSVNGWTPVADLPAGAAAESTSISVVQGRIWLAYAAAEKVHLAEQTDAGWRETCLVDKAPAFELIANALVPLLSTHAGGRVTVYDVSGPKPLPVRSLEIVEPAAAAVVDSSLRFVTTDGVKIKQTGFDEYGRGSKFGPDVIAQVGANAQASREWWNVVIVGALTMIMLATLRQRPGDETGIPENSTLQIAALPRRIFAGLIDAIPLLAANAWFWSRVSGSSYTPEQMAEMFYLPELIGLALYVAHVTVSELMFGRSIGKLIFGLKVVTLQGEPVPPGRIVLRNLIRIIEMPLFIALLLILMSPSAQRLGDMAARTLVVRDPETKNEPAGRDAPPQGE